MENQTKLRLFYLYQHMIKYSDPDHRISTNELIKYLKDKHGISADRTTITDDFALMKQAGINCECRKSRQNQYYYDDRLFETAELKSLIDAVASAKFITESRSKQLIRKLMTLTSVYNAENLRSHVVAEGRVKSENTNSYIISDAINEAIDKGFKIRFRYTDYSIHKKRVLRNGGEWYVVSPYTLVWDGDYYYLIGYCDNRQHTRNFRIDRIHSEVEKLEDQPAVPAPADYDPATYSKRVFRMFDSDEIAQVDLFCEAPLMKYVIDQFGKEVKTEVLDKDHFAAHVAVCLSPNFYRWVFGWGGRMKISGPEHVRNEYKARLEDALKNA
jgi:predicted DNA-binding transcriptional regulator YafY